MLLGAAEEDEEDEEEDLELVRVAVAVPIALVEVLLEEVALLLEEVEERRVEVDLDVDEEVVPGRTGSRRLLVVVLVVVPGLTGASLLEVVVLLMLLRAAPRAGASVKSPCRLTCPASSLSSSLFRSTGVALANKQNEKRQKSSAR